MSMIPRGPTMPHNEPTGRYVLSINPTVQRPPRDGLERLERVLSKPVWSQADRDRLARASYGMSIHEFVDWDRGKECPGPDGCVRCAMARRIDPMVAEWDRIRQAHPIPTTAQLRNALRRPDNAVRAARLYRDLAERRIERIRIVHATVKPYKTDKVRWKHELRATEADPQIRRLNRALDRVMAIRPDVQTLARTLH